MNRLPILALLILSCSFQLVTYGQEYRERDKTSEGRLSENARWAFEISQGFGLTNTEGKILSVTEQYGYRELILGSTSWVDQNFSRIGNLSASILYRAGRQTFVGIKVGGGNMGAVDVEHSSGSVEKINFWDLYLAPSLQIGFTQRPHFFLKAGILLDIHTFHYRYNEEVIDETKIGLYVGAAIPIIISNHFMWTLNLDYLHAGKVELGFNGFSDHINNNRITLGMSIWWFRLVYGDKQKFINP